MEFPIITQPIAYFERIVIEIKIVIKRQCPNWSKVLVLYSLVRRVAISNPHRKNWKLKIQFWKKISLHE